MRLPPVDRSSVYRPARSRQFIGGAHRRPATPEHAGATATGRLLQGQRWCRSRRTTHLQAVLGAGATGLEPATSGVTGRRSNQLSYAPRIGVKASMATPEGI